MDTKSKILILAVLVLILFAAGITYYKIMVKRNYVVQAEVDCDPYEEQCFIWECDPEAAEGDDEACAGDPEEDIWYYKIAERNAASIPDCDPEENENCDLWTCSTGEQDCGEILCDEETSAEWEADCSDPEGYALENPIEEEDLSADETECDPEEDEECINEEEDSDTEEEMDSEEDTEDASEDLTDESANLGGEE